MDQSIRLLGVCAMISIPAALLGIALGYAASAKAASALANLIFLPLAFLGGLWIPPIGMPDVVKDISLWTPTRHMAEFAWGSVANALPDTNFILGLAAYTIVFGALVLLLVKRDRQKRFG
jgi:ABC-2 type transport system permease protein